MNKECAQHENIIVERLTKTIDDKIELSVTMKISKLTKWIIGTIFTVFLAVISVLLSSFYFMGKMDTQMLTINKYMDAQTQTNKELKKLNSNLSQELEDTKSYQMVIMANMKRLDPDFLMPRQLRGDLID